MKKLLLLLIVAIVSVNCLAQAKDKDGRPDTYNYNRAMEAIGKEDYDEALDYLNKEIQEDSKNGYAYSWITMIMLRQEEFGRALTAADKAVKYLPKKDAEYISFTYANRADIYLNLNDTVRALEDYAAAIKIKPEVSTSYERRAQIYYEQKKYDLADADYRKLISLDQGSVMGYMGIGRNRNAQKRWDEAIEQFDYVIKLHSDYSSAYAFRAESYLGKEDWAKATDDLVKAIELDTDRKAVYTAYTLSEPAFTMAIAKMKVQAAKAPNNYLWPFVIANMYITPHDYKKALEYFKKANVIEVSDGTYERIASCYKKLGQYADALENIDRAIAMDSTDLSYKADRAEILYEMGDADAAIAQWDEILAARPEFAGGYQQRGWYKELIGDLDGAVEDQTMAVVLDPTHAYAYLNRGQVYQKQLKTDLAEADFRKVTELEDSPEKYTCVHYAWQGLGQNDKAIAVMDSIIARDTTDAGNYYDAACLYSRMKNKDKALEYLEKSLKKGYVRFAHMDRDYDLDFLRETEEYKALVDKYKSKRVSAPNSRTPGTSVDKETVTTEIPFTKEDGICKVKCNINGLPLHFVFDTGASTVSLSMVEATFMMKNDFLSEKDVVGSQHFLDANGNVSVGTVINLRKVDFGGLELTNVRASVVRNQKAPLLLGQSVLSRLGKIEIDNARHMLKITHHKSVVNNGKQNVFEFLPVVIATKTPNLEAWDKKDWQGMPYREGRVTVNDSTRYALVVFLHGANGGGTDNVKHHQNEHGHYQILDYWEKNRMKGIVLMPQCPIGQSWTNLQMKDKLKGLIEHYAAADSVDASHVYICGTSNGALGGWSMIQSYHNLFAGAMLAAAVPQGNSGGVPVCVVTGKHEGNQGNAMANLEAQKGVDVKYIYRPGWNHGQTCQQSFRETGCLDWLFEHRR